MKNKIILTLLLLLSFQAIISQNAYNDAVKLKELIKAGSNPPKFKNDSISLVRLGEILYNYLKIDTSQVTQKNYDLIKSELSDSNGDNYNTFLKDFLSNTPNGEAPNFIEKKNLLETVGSTPVTNFADGLAKFLIKRAKQELLISFFNNLRDSDKNPEFAMLFPNTKAIVDSFEAWEYANILNTLKEALNKDLKLLLGNIPKLNTLKKDDPKYSDSVKKRVNAIKKFFEGDSGRLLNAALSIGNGFTTQQKIPDIIHDIASTDGLAGLSTASLSANGKNIIRLLDILSYSIRSNEFGKSYISNAELKSMFADTHLMNLYLGLLYQQLKNESITIGGTDIATLLSSAAELPKIKGYINTLTEQADTLNSAYTELKEAKKKGETDLSPYWAKIFENANDFFQTTLNLKSINPSYKFPQSVQDALTLSTNTIEIASDIANKNYSAAVVSTLKLFPKSSTNDSSEFRTFFVKYASFAANVVEAKNSDEVETAIESVALPVGSATIKKKSCFNIALNAYLGGFYGQEYLAEKTTDKWAKSAGVYAPVGVTFSVGFQKAGSLSFLLNVIDIGAVAAYRLNDSETEELPEISLQNILAPGVGLIYGIPGIPLSFGASYQLGPALREITPTAATTSAQMNGRWQVFLAVDIPIFNFYTSTK